MPDRWGVNGSTAIPESLALIAAENIRTMSATPEDAEYLLAALGLDSLVSGSNPLDSTSVPSSARLNPEIPTMTEQTMQQTVKPEQLAHDLAEFTMDLYGSTEGAVVGEPCELVSTNPESFYEFNVTIGDRLILVTVREEEKDD